MQFINTIQAMQKLGGKVVKEGRGILKKKRKQLVKTHYIMIMII